MRYALGVISGILSGLAFTAASIAQKRAMNALCEKAPLFRSLVKSPLWLAGFAASFLVGAPLNTAAYMAIGPTLPPALGSIGLAAVPILARLFLPERPGLLSYLGAAALAAGVALIGLSGFSIRPEGVDWTEPDFILRAAIAIGSIVLFAVLCLCFGLRGRGAKTGAAALSLAAGSAQALTNALMAPIAGQLGLLASGDFGPIGLVIMGAASLGLAAVNFGAIAIAQVALRRGQATNVLPIQQVPIQLLPIVLHAALYRGDSGGTGALLALALGLTLLLSGAVALGPGIGGRRARGMARAGTALVVAIAASALAPSPLQAQESESRVYRYLSLDAAGRQVGESELRVRPRGAGFIVEYADSEGRRESSVLGPGPALEALRVEAGPSIAARSYRLDAAAGIWVVDGGSRPAIAWERGAFLNNSGLFLVIPALVDLRKAGAEALFVMVMPESGQRVTMRLRSLGPTEAADAAGSPVAAYGVVMEIADPLARLFWPHAYRYFFRPGDLALLRFEGPGPDGKDGLLVLAPPDR